MKKITIVFFLTLITTSLVFAQSRKERKMMKKEKAKKEFLATKEIVDSGKMKFKFDWAVAQKGARVSLQGRGDSMALDTTSMSGVVELPYFGAVQVPSMSGSGGISISGDITDYSVKYKESKNKAFIKFKAKSSENEIFSFNLTITGSGSTNMGVTSSHRNRISYTGIMTALDI